MKTNLSRMPLASGIGMVALLGWITLVPSCATTSSSSTVWTEPAPGPAWARPGHVEWVREIVHRQEGNPVGGAVAGALIGGLLFGGRGPSAVVGAAGGAAVGAAASQGTYEQRSYEVLVRFDDGTTGMFVYARYSPFRPGERVVLTQQGLMRG